MSDTPTKHLKQRLYLLVIVLVIVGSIATVASIHFGAQLLKSGFKSGTNSIGSKFQFDVDVADAHSELHTYYRANNSQYPTNKIGIKHSKFTYVATPSGCNNIQITCTGYVITHKDYGKSQTNLDYRVKTVK